MVAVGPTALAGSALARAMPSGSATAVRPRCLVANAQRLPTIAGTGVTRAELWAERGRRRYREHVSSPQRPGRWERCAAAVLLAGLLVGCSPATSSPPTAASQSVPLSTGPSAATVSTASATVATSPGPASTSRLPTRGAPSASSLATGTSGTRSSEETVASNPGAASDTTVPTAGGAPALPLQQCRAARLKTLIPRILTVGTTEVPDPPWFETATPADGRGLDAAVIAEVAATLGYSPEQVRWRPGGGVAALSPATVDVVIGALEIPADGSSAQDYSTGYYDLSTAVLARTGTPAASVRSTAGLAGLRIGAVTGSNDAMAFRSAVPGGKPVGYPDDAALLGAVTAGDVDAAAVPTWRAFQAVKADAGLTVVGVLPSGAAQPPQLGIALAPGSKLTPCVSAAVDAIRVQGDLDTLAATWVGTAPTLH